MRLKVNLIRISKRNKLQINYLGDLANILRDVIKSKKLENGPDHPRPMQQIKYLTFSLLQIPNRFVILNYILMKDEQAYFYVSSPNDSLLKHIKEGLLKKSIFSLAGIKFKIASIDSYTGPKFTRGIYRFSTLSPIVLRVPENNDSGLKKIRFMYATDDDFQTALKINLIKRFVSYYNQIPIASTFEIKKIHRFKPVTYRIGTKYYRGNRIVFEVFGSPELLKFAFECGLGEYTHLGFGMIKVLAEQKKLKERDNKKEKPLQFL